MAAAVSTTMRWVALGILCSHVRVTRLSVSQAAIGCTTGSGGCRFLTQRSADPCGSWSMSTTGSPRAAKWLARLMAMVVLPEPPLGLSTTMRCMLSAGSAILRQ
jgi:hypothetical protein